MTPDPPPRTDRRPADMGETADDDGTPGAARPFLDRLDDEIDLDEGDR